MSVINYVFVDPIFISIQSLDIANFYEYIWKYMHDAQASPNGLREFQTRVIEQRG